MSENDQAKSDPYYYLVFSAQAAERHGYIVAKVPDGAGETKKISYTAMYQDPECLKTSYHFPDAKIVWSGKESDVEYVKNYDGEYTKMSKDPEPMERRPPPKRKF